MSTKTEAAGGAGKTQGVGGEGRLGFRSCHRGCSCLLLLPAAPCCYLCAPNCCLLPVRPPLTPPPTHPPPPPSAVAACVTPQAAEAAVMGLSVSPGELKTETVEEFISISDGQVRHKHSQHTGLVVSLVCVGTVLTNSLKQARA
jgi:hypothetical protein